MPHHTVLFAGDYKTNVNEMMAQKKLSADPSIYVHNPGIHDRTLAPQGKTALYALMPVPNLTSGIDWQEQGR